MTARIMGHRKKIRARRLRPTVEDVSLAGRRYQAGNYLCLPVLTVPRVTQRIFACLRHLRDAPYWLQTVTTIGLPSPPRLPLSVPGMVAVLPGAAGTVPEVLVCVRLNSPPSTVLCQLTAPSWYQ